MTLPPTVSLPDELPGLSVPPLATVSIPLMVPPPPRVAPLCTLTEPVPVAEPLPVGLLTSSVPACTVVPPE